MNLPLNPYESPVYPEEVILEESADSLTATFTIEPSDQWASVEAAPAPLSPKMLVMAGFVLLAYVSTWLILSEAGLLIANFTGLLFLVFMFVTQYYHTQSFRRETLQALRDHPVLGAIGSWKLTVRGEHLIVETAGGVRVFARSRTRIWDSGHQLVLWLDSLPIVIPQYESYASMCEAVRRRLRMK